MKDGVSSLSQLKTKAVQGRISSHSVSHAELHTSQTQAVSWETVARSCHNLHLNSLVLPHLTKGTHSPLSSGELSWLQLCQLQQGFLLENFLLSLFPFECSSFSPPIWMTSDIFLLCLLFVVTWLWWSFSLNHLSFWEVLWILSGVHVSTGFSLYSQSLFSQFLSCLTQSYSSWLPKHSITFVNNQILLPQ